MQIDKHDVLEHTIEAFVADLVDHIKDGWEVDPSAPGDAIQMGMSYTVSLFRSDDTIEAFKEEASKVTGKPKLSRAEILEKARAAKKSGSAKLDMGVVNA